MREKDKEIVNILKDVNMFERNMIVAIRSNIQGVFLDALASLDFTLVSESVSEWAEFRI